MVAVAGGVYADLDDPEGELVAALRDAYRLTGVARSASSCSVCIPTSRWSPA